MAGVRSRSQARSAGAAGVSLAAAVASVAADQANLIDEAQARVVLTVALVAAGLFGLLYLYGWWQDRRSTGADEPSVSQTVTGNMNTGGNQFNAPVSGSGHTFNYNLAPPPTKPDVVVPMSFLTMGDGVTQEFQTLSPYKPGSLSVAVDGLFQHSTEIDPATGRFSVPFVASPSEQIMASWTIDPHAKPLDQWRKAKIADGNGVTRIFRTPTPYEPNTLAVTVDGVSVNGLVETNPWTGEFDLGWAPDGPEGDSRAEAINARWKVAQANPAAARRQSLANARSAVNDQITIGGEILNRVRNARTSKVAFQDYDNAVRPEVMGWHEANRSLVRTHFDAVRGRYSGASELPTFAEFIDSHRTTRAPALLRAEVESFVGSRINELRALLQWEGTL